MSHRLSRRTLLKLSTLALTPGSGGCGDEADVDVPETEGSRLYPARPSLLAGETVTLHVSCSAPQFQVSFWRVGAPDKLAFTSEWCDGVQVPLGHPSRDFGYPGYDFPTTGALEPGVYVAALREGADGRELSVQSDAVVEGKAQALFVVRTPRSRAGNILYKLPLATHQAYNFTGGGSLYHVARRDGRPVFRLKDARAADGIRGDRVSLRRPGGGLGGDSWHEERDPYLPDSPRNTFTHWDAPFIRWLEQHGHAADYCVDLDIHGDATLLDPYTLLVSAGHDEYWSEPQRDHTEQFLRRGGNLAFFGGNTCWWRVHYTDDLSTMICDKAGRRERDKWSFFRPEDSLTGVSYRHAGSWWRGRRTALGYTVQHPDHWVYAGTGLAAGDEFGSTCTPPLIGYECDGAPFFRDAHGVAVARPDPAVGTPASFLILGLAELGHEWQVRLGKAATMGIFDVPGGGSVFNAATVDWPLALAQDARVAQITHNVLERLGSP